MDVLDDLLNQRIPDEVKITLILGVQELQRLASARTLGEHLENTGMARRSVVVYLSRLTRLGHRVGTLHLPDYSHWSSREWCDAAWLVQALAPVSKGSSILKAIPASADRHSAGDGQALVAESERLLSELVMERSLPRWLRQILADLLEYLASKQAQDTLWHDPDYVWYRSLAVNTALAVSVCQQMGRLDRSNENATTFGNLGYGAGEQLLTACLLLFGVRRYQAALEGMSQISESEGTPIYE